MQPFVPDFDQYCPQMRGNQLMDESIESPISKQKYKQIQKLIDDCERNESPFSELLKLAMTKLVQLEIPIKI